MNIGISDIALSSSIPNRFVVDSGGDEDVFPEWHNSEIAELYQPKIYENNKSDKGYWF